MKLRVLGLILAGLMMPAVAWCQPEGPEGRPEYQMELDQRKLELDNQRAEMEFKRRMAELELEARRAEIEQSHKPEGGGVAVLLIVCAVIHVLVAVWIYQDIRRRNAGSGVWIVLGLLAGLIAALVYAVVRLGDSNNGKKKTDG